jgi:diaminobutyrate-2-oxoglutarate transaminase
MRNESNVNAYARVFPAVFDTAEGDIVIDKEGKRYIDFFSGAGTLNYGHNHRQFKQAVYSFLERNAVVHCLDMDSVMKDIFLEKFETIILKPRGLDHKVQFSGPTGTNAVEAAIKLARIVTKRRKIISFTHSFHGMSATSLALSGSREEQHKINPAQDVLFFPYDGFLGERTDTIGYLKKMILTEGSGCELPAAIILETVQAEGGVNVASSGWLQELRDFTQQNGILLIVDDIQVGCGRTGAFFSFERAGIVPDIILLSKSISGFGLPLSLVLIKPQFDLWKQGGHTGTFRSNNLSLCTAAEALDFWKDDLLRNKTAIHEKCIRERLDLMVARSGHVKEIRGIGMIWGIEFFSSVLASGISRTLFDQGMIIETCGNKDQVLKLLPPLTISEMHLQEGLQMLESAIENIGAADHIPLEKDLASIS